MHCKRKAPGGKPVTKDMFVAANHSKATRHHATRQVTQQTIRTALVGVGDERVTLRWLGKVHTSDTAERLKELCEQTNGQAGRQGKRI